MTDRTRLILASGSPRRRHLLEVAGIDFEASVSGLDEIRMEGEGATEFALRMAVEKALAVSRSTEDRALVLAADTVVECGGEILGKPGDAAEACRMLRALSGRVHTVVTAFALARASATIESLAVISRVRFRRLGDDEIDAYVRTGEPMDKAGAYGIQGQGGGFIAEVEGSRDNVMGLPVNETLAALARHGITPRPRPEG